MWSWGNFWGSFRDWSRNGIFNSNRWQGMGTAGCPPNYRELSKQLKIKNRKKNKIAKKSRRKNRRR